MNFETFAKLFSDFLNWNQNLNSEKDISGGPAHRLVVRPAKMVIGSCMLGQNRQQRLGAVASAPRMAASH
jgi:hypothetical protein